MKKYLSFGELLIDYRNLNNISQSDLAARLNVDVRTVIRWEKDETLVKPEKEEELVKETFIPYQVIRNLNATVPLPTYYDFRIRKYSLTEISTDIPDASWFIKEMGHTTNRIRPIELDSDIDNIMRYAQFEYHTFKPVSKQLIKEAVKLLPELNFVIFDDAGYYCGHSVVFPIGTDTYEKLKNREIEEGELRAEDLINFRQVKNPVFHSFEITADCNDNSYYIVGELLRFFKEKAPADYIYSLVTTRHDTYEIQKQAGHKIIWEDKEVQDEHGQVVQQRFLEGNFSKILMGE